MAISEVTDVNDTTTTSTTDVLLTNMTLTPGAGEYLAVFSTDTNAVAAATIGCGIYVGGTQQAHTDRDQFQEGSIVGEASPLMTHAWVTVAAGQAVEIKWRTSASTATSHRRSLQLFPIQASKVSQFTATGDTTLGTAATYTQLNTMTTTPGDGTYLLLFSTTAQNSVTATIDMAVFVNGVIVQHTERTQFQEGSIPLTDYVYAIFARITAKAGEVVEIRWKTSVITATAHERTLTLFRTDNLEQATDTGDATTASTTDVVLTNMTLTPGADTWLALFSTSLQEAATSGNSIFTSIYVNAAQIASSQRSILVGGSIPITPIPVMNNGVITPGVGQVADIRWRKSAGAALATSNERTFVLLREDRRGPIVGAVRIANKNVGPRAMRHTFRQPYLPWFAAAGVSAFTLSLDSGAYSITGVNATLLANRVLDANVGAYTITGFDATLAKGYSLVLDLGTYTITGATTTLLADRMLSANAGSYTITGVTAMLLAGRMLSADLGSYTITGFDATLAKGYSFILDSGTYAITGATTTLLTDRMLSADSGSYTITGVAATLLAGRTLSADPGSYTITGFAAIPLVGRMLSADAGVYILTGSTATLLATRMLSADSGSYDVAGFAATLVVTTAGVFTLSADAGEYTVTGFSAELVFVPIKPVTKPMGFYGISFRKRKRMDEEPAVVVDVSEAADMVEVANYVDIKLDEAGLRAKDVAGLLAKLDSHRKTREALESVLPYSELEAQEDDTEAVSNMELSMFLDRFLAQRAEPMFMGIRKKDFDAIIAAIIASEL